MFGPPPIEAGRQIDVLMRIVHVNLSPPGYGGIERLLVDFLRYFRGTEFDVELCVLDRENDVSLRLSAEGYHITHLARRAGTVDWRLWRRLGRHLAERRCDVVHLHGTPGLMFGVPAARMYGRTRIVYTCHFSQSTYSYLKHAVLGVLLRNVDRCVAVSHAAREVLAVKYHQRREAIQIIHNGVDTRAFGYRSPDTVARSVVVGFCGLFRSEKQIPRLLDSVAVLRRDGLPVRLSLIGDGAEFEVCRDRAIALGLENIVTFHGMVSDVRQLVSDMDVFVLPSKEEAMPVALLEAMAVGCAPVASAVGGIPEVIEHGRSGLLVSPDDTNALTDAIRRLVTNPVERLQIGAEARKKIEAEFSLDAMMSSYARLYRDLYS